MCGYICAAGPATYLPGHGDRQVCRGGEKGTRVLEARPSRSPACASCVRDFHGAGIFFSDAFTSPLPSPADKPTGEGRFK